MKRLIVFGLLLFFSATSSVSAQDKLKVAVFDPAISGSVFDEGAGVIIREMVSSTLVNTGRYTIIERSLIDRILSEQKFSNSGAVDDSQVSQLGKLAGANKVVLSVLSSAGNRGLLSLKVIDVESASVESQQTQLVDHDRIYDIITPTTLALIGEQVVIVPTTAPQSQTTTTSRNSDNTLANIGNAFSSMFGGDGQGRSQAAEARANRREAKLEMKESGASRDELREAKQSDKEQFAARMEDEMTFPTTATSAATSNSGAIKVVFPGGSLRKNPDARIYVNGSLVGSGSFNQGFSVAFDETSGQGKYDVRVEWSDTVESKTYTVDTRDRKNFEFEYVRGGFGYEFRLKNSR